MLYKKIVKKLKKRRKDKFSLFGFDGIIATKLLVEDPVKTYDLDNLKQIDGNVAIYARVANNEDHGLERQVCYLVDKVNAVGGNTYKVFTEVASGLETLPAKREALFSMLDEIQKGKIKRVYIKCRDRFSRDYVFTNKIVNMIVCAGAEIIEVL